MKITYLRLENMAAMRVAQQTDVIEIDFTKSKNRIISIQGVNGSGKSSLISTLSPFSGVTSVDERSSLPFITPGKNGYKEIHYEDNGNKYVIKHHYKATKDSHSVKSYFMMNGEELNQNGNVGSFMSLVEIHLDITPEMMRLVRLGTNVNSFISLKPAERKNYIGKLIDEIDMYLKIHKKVNEDIRVVKTLISANSNNLNRCAILDPTVEMDRLTSLKGDLKSHEKERDKLKIQIGRLEAMERDNNIDELRKKRLETEAQLVSFRQAEKDINDNGLAGVSIESLLEKRNKLGDLQVDIKSKINSYRLSIDSNVSRINTLTNTVNRMEANLDIESLTSMIRDLHAAVANTPEQVKTFKFIGCGSDTLNELLMRLSSFNQMGETMISFGDTPVDHYIKLRKNNVNIDKYIAEQTKRRLSTIGDKGIKRLLAEVFKDDVVITPNCVSEFEDCPFYRFAGVINEYRKNTYEDIFDEDILRYIRTIAINIDNMLNELDHLRTWDIPNNFKEIMTERQTLENFKNKLPFFNLSDLRSYIAMVRSYEVYCDQVTKLKQAERELEMHKSSGIERYLEDIRLLKNENATCSEKITVAEKELAKCQSDITTVESQIALLTTYNDGLKYRDIMESTLKSTLKILEPLENASNERQDLIYQLRNVENVILRVDDDIRQLENQLNEYHRLIEEGKKLSDKFDKLSVVLESVSTKKGIPIIYMNAYLGRIRRLTNRLLSIIYGDRLLIDKFHITSDEFSIPYIKNGTRIPDVRYSSQSEIAMVTMALSFALSHSASQKYNILILDEMDSGLDSDSRLAFLKMLDTQLNELHSEQTFMISHNIGQMVNLPMDVIALSETDISLSSVNVIYP